MACISQIKLANPRRFTMTYCPQPAVVCSGLRLAPMRVWTKESSPLELCSTLLEGGYIGEYLGDHYEGYSGDTWSFDP